MLQIKIQGINGKIMPIQMIFGHFQGMILKERHCIVGPQSDTSYNIILHFVTNTCHNHRTINRIPDFHNQF